ncbi:MAG: prolipoprotein diacylglyceryl transferase [Anaerolineales bacterium]|nr:prolipoprotein diacylglyceryl transferase [Anaerolineales bacterium]
MFPILAQLGPVTLYTYSILLNLGLALGLAWLYVTAPTEKKVRRLDIGIAAIVGGLLGARLVYVVVNGGYFLTNPVEALMIWRGGLSWVGAAAGALLGAGWWARRLGEPLLPVLDAAAPPIVLLSTITWGGCLAAGCAYGAEVAPGQLPAWFAPPAPDLYGLSVPRWPTQALGIGWGVFSLLAVFGLRRQRWPEGAQGLYALGLVALGAFFISFMRGDPMPLVNGLRLDVVGSALVLVGAAAAWALRVRSRTSVIVEGSD